MNLRLQKLLKLHKLMDAAGEGGSDTGGTGAAAQEGNTPGKAESDEGDGEGDDPAGTKTAEEGDGSKKPTDSEAGLLRDVMKHKGRANQLQGQISELQGKLAQFDGVDVEAYKAWKAEQAELERKQLEARGEYDRLTQQMAQRHKEEMESTVSERETLRSEIGSLQQQISELTVGNAFATSPVIGEMLLMTRAKARKVYGEHFDFVDGKVVGFDKPRGSAERTQLVDSSGEPLSFNDALIQLVKADPDPERDQMLRSNAKPGAGSAPANTSLAARKGIAAEATKRAMTPAERISAGLRMAAAAA
ncbi:hypothetical protein ATN89_17505 [Comamonas thiooxydans]|uniref:DUF6651 domain-containing protein n=1 Tax=Comamonas thiooxydans TaxID=363952 RepID=UPI0007C5D357|nr:DUF6651 domain-containing protein [Comamonas thiooxydans]OAD82879.1 hypothetical protein ATN89_17505 [Comamonas thiooxydans]